MPTDKTLCVFCENTWRQNDMHQTSQNHYLQKRGLGCPHEEKEP